jgi:glycosyltransferase involved in cell wall biosynthesis
MNRLLRVGFDLTPSGASSAGISRYTKDLSAALGRTPGVHIERLMDHEAPGAAHAPRVMRRAGRRLAYYPAMLDRTATHRDVDVLHCPSPMLPLRTTLPLVVTVHDVLAWRSPELYSRAGAAQQRLLVSRAAKRADRILVASEYTRSELVDLLGISPDRVTAVPLGVDRRFQPIEPEPMQLAHRFGIPPNPFVLWVGTPEPRKNLATLLRAFGLVRRRAPDCMLVVVGMDRVTDRDLERELEHLGASVIRPGFVTDDDLVALYSATACLVFPSLNEGFGLPPLEAMACGAPVVASNRSSIPEVVGDAGILVDATDADAIADGIERVVLSKESAADLRRRGLERARQFTWDRCAQLTVAAYHEAIANH